jgi:hypothetical protein
MSPAGDAAGRTDPGRRITVKHVTYWLAGLLAGCALALTPRAGVADDPKPKKEKPADAESYDDQKAEAKTVTDGKPATRKLEAKRSLRVAGYFAKDGFHIEKVTEGGPAMQLQAADGTPAAMEAGDIISEVDGKKVTSAADYVAALDGAKDIGKVKLKVIDVNTGNAMDFTVTAAERKSLPMDG